MENKNLSEKVNNYKGITGKKIGLLGAGLIVASSLFSGCNFLRAISTGYDLQQQRQEQRINPLNYGEEYQRRIATGDVVAGYFLDAVKIFGLYQAKRWIDRRNDNDDDFYFPQSGDQHSEGPGVR